MAPFFMPYPIFSSLTNFTSLLLYNKKAGAVFCPAHYIELQHSSDHPHLTILVKDESPLKRLSLFIDEPHYRSLPLGA